MKATTSENLSMAEGLLDIAQNASIRGMRVDGEDRFSVLDFIKYVCPERNSNYAKNLWQRLFSKHCDELFRITQFVQFDGKGQKLTPTMTMSGLQILLHVMEGNHIKPISATPAGHFDAEVLHYTNIQPLSAEDNLRKGARWSHDDEIFWRTHIFGNAAWEQVYLPE
jgi:hypothetical protein